MSVLAVLGPEMPMIETDLDKLRLDANPKLQNPTLLSFPPCPPLTSTATFPDL